MHIKCVAWNPAQPISSTREILIGAHDGTIYETYIEPSSEFYRREEKYVKAVHRSQFGPVTGIWIDEASHGADQITSVILASATALVRFTGRSGRSGNDNSGSRYSRLFENEAPVVYQDSKPSTNIPTMLAASPEPNDENANHNASAPERGVAWLSQQGVYHGSIPTTSADEKQQILSAAKTLPRDTLQSLASSLSSSNNVQSIALTTFHVLALVGTRLLALNRLDDSVVFDQAVLESGQSALALVCDQKKDTFWLFTQRDIFEIVITDEARHIWKIMLANKQFDKAAQFATTPTQRDTVAAVSGDHLLAQAKYSAAANAYGASSKPFEEVALAFLDHGADDALRRYLLVKLSSLKRSSTMQRIMIASWLVELFMAKLDSLDDHLSTKTVNTATNEQSSLDSDVTISSLRKEYQDFITKYKTDLDAKTTYELINSHGREEELLFFATANQDYSYILAYLAERERWQEAMTIVKKQTEPEVFYRYSNVLMEFMPVEFIDVVMRQTNLDPSALIPALLHYDKLVKVPLAQNQAVRYLQFCVNHQQCTDTAVHNTLISIYASNSSSDESALLAYLDLQSSTRERNYDPDFALRLCIAHECIQSCVHIYSDMHQYASAVDVALAHDQIDLAARAADLPKSDTALRKKLWLRVARKVISKSDGIKPALDFLKQCELLRVEDLIPFFPDFVVIDDFKDEICDALEGYSRQIEALKTDMDQSVDTAQHIRDEIAALSLRYAIVEPGERCWSCSLPLLMRQFFVFPCQHAFHADCLGKMVVDMAGAVQGKRIRELQAEIGRGVVSGKKKERLVKEYDSLIAASCVLCSELAVKRIDQPFITEADDKNEWTV